MRGGPSLATLTAQPAPEERPRPDKLWHNGEFLRLWLGQTVSSVGTGIVKLAAPLLVLALTDSPAMAGLVTGALTLPMVFLGLPAGAIIDRSDRRRLMIACDVIRSVAVLSVPVTWVLGGLNPWHLVGVALVLGSAQSFFNIAQVAALPRVVERRQIPAAHALNTTSEGVALLASPGLGGMIVAAGPTPVAGGVAAYGINGLTFLVSVLALAGIATPFQAKRARGSHPALLRSMVDGLRYVWQERPIRLLMVVNGFHRCCFAPVMLTVVVLARQDLGLDPAAIGLLFSTAGAGGLSAAAVTPWLRRRVPVGWHMIAIVALHGLALALVAAAGSVWLVAAGLYLAGMMETMTGITQVSYRLVLIPDMLQGRVNSVYRLVSFGAMSLGAIGGGLLVDLHGPRPVMWLIAAAMLVIASGTALSGVRGLRDE